MAWNQDAFSVEDVPVDEREFSPLEAVFMAWNQEDTLAGEDDVPVDVDARLEPYHVEPVLAAASLPAAEESDFSPLDVVESQVLVLLLDPEDELLYQLLDAPINVVLLFGLLVENHAEALCSAAAGTLPAITNETRTAVNASILHIINSSFYLAVSWPSNKIYTNTLEKSKESITYKKLSFQPITLPYAVNSPAAEFLEAASFGGSIETDEITFLFLYAVDQFLLGISPGILNSHLSGFIFNLGKSHFVPPWFE